MITNTINRLISRPNNGAYIVDFLLFNPTDACNVEPICSYQNLHNCTHIPDSVKIIGSVLILDCNISPDSYSPFLEKYNSTTNIWTNMNLVKGFPYLGPGFIFNEFANYYQFQIGKYRIRWHSDTIPTEYNVEFDIVPTKFSCTDGQCIKDAYGDLNYITDCQTAICTKGVRNNYVTSYGTIGYLGDSFSFTKGDCTAKIECINVDTKECVYYPINPFYEMYIWEISQDLNCRTINTISILSLDTLNKIDNIWESNPLSIQIKDHHNVPIGFGTTLKSSFDGLQTYRIVFGEIKKWWKEIPQKTYSIVNNKIVEDDNGPYTYLKEAQDALTDVGIINTNCGTGIWNGCTFNIPNKYLIIGGSIVTLAEIISIMTKK